MLRKFLIPNTSNHQQRALTSRLLSRQCVIDSGALGLLEHAMNHPYFSARGSKNLPSSNETADPYREEGRLIMRWNDRAGGFATTTLQGTGF